MRAPIHGSQNTNWFEARLWPCCLFAVAWVWVFVSGACGFASAQESTPTNAVPKVAAVPGSLRDSLKLAPFYQKYLDADGLPVLGSTNVSDYAMLEARWILRHMLSHRPEILQIMASNRARLVVMAHNEYTTDIPEQANQAPKVFWDRRARGLGGRLSSCAEENLLCFPGDPYSTENILIHEFGHAILNVGMRTIDPGFKDRVREAYRKATEAGLWKGTYAGTDVEEYWAEGVQDWFDNNRENDAQHNSVNTRTELKEYDPALAALCAEVFGETPWRYVKPMNRPAEERAHLTGFDPSKSPRFRWRETALTEKPRVRLQTSMGEIEVELYAKQAPVTVTNFLRYVLEGFYRDGEFFRTVTLENQPTNNVKIQVVQAQATTSRQHELFPPIPLERTRDTGIKHLDGTLSMARNGPDTAQDSFSICIGDQPELDYGGKRNPDGQGFAAFGRVVKGMDVVRGIHQSPANGQLLTPSVRIQGAFRVH
jgi:cyclophilin family peptidyl-prolyl cis-trans isomerase